MASGWWSQSGISSFATSALQKAQKQIDKALDIPPSTDPNAPKVSDLSALPSLFSPSKATTPASTLDVKVPEQTRNPLETTVPAALASTSPAATVPGDASKATNDRIENATSDADADHDDTKDDESAWQTAALVSPGRPRPMRHSKTTVVHAEDQVDPKPATNLELVALSPPETETNSSVIESREATGDARTRSPSPSPSHIPLHPLSSPSPSPDPSSSLDPSPASAPVDAPSPSPSPSPSPAPSPSPSPSPSPAPSPSPSPSPAPSPSPSPSPAPSPSPSPSPSPPACEPKLEDVEPEIRTTPRTAPVDAQLLKFVGERDAFLMQLEDAKVELEQVRGRIAAEYEERLGALQRECARWKDTAEALRSTSDGATRTAAELVEARQQIAEFVKEGEKLSRQELQTNTRMRKAVTQIKELREQVKSLEGKLEGSETQVASLKKSLADARENVVAADARAAVAAADAASAEKDRERATRDAQSAQATVSTLEQTVVTLRSEVSQLRVANAEALATAEAAQEAARGTATTELRATLQEHEQQNRVEKAALEEQVTTLTEQLSREAATAAKREDALLAQVAEARQRVEDAAARNEQLSASVTEATQPLLRQLEALDRTHKARSQAWEAAENALMGRVEDAEQQVANAEERARHALTTQTAMQTRLCEVEARLADEVRARAEAESLRESLQATVDVQVAEKAAAEGRLAALLQSSDQEQQRLRNACAQTRQECTGLREDMQRRDDTVKRLRTQLAEVSHELNTLRRRTQEESEQQALQAERQHSQGVVDGEEANEALAGESAQSILTSATTSSSAAQPAFSASSSSSSSSVAHLLPELERLRAALKRKEGECAALRERRAESDSQTARMAEELLTITNRTEELEETIKRQEETLESVHQLQRQHNALLELYGEREEECGELRMDLNDVKSMFRTQIEQLLDQIETLQSGATRIKTSGEPNVAVVASFDLKQDRGGKKEAT